jgi:hypothetical protein
VISGRMLRRGGSDRVRGQRSPGDARTRAGGAGLGPLARLHATMARRPTYLARDPARCAARCRARGTGPWLACQPVSLIIAAQGGTRPVSERREPVRGTGCRRA